MKMRYSQLRGLPVYTSEGAILGRVSDLLVGKRGDSAVAHTLVVVPGALRAFLDKLGVDVDVLAVPAGDIADIDPRAATLRFPRSHYR